MGKFEEVKERVSNGYVISGDIDWLVEHAEKVRNLKAVNKQLKDMYEAKCEEIETIQNKLDVVIDELLYGLRLDKHVQNRDFYINNAIRFIQEAKEIPQTQND